jgi:hypothetical protein
MSATQLDLFDRPSPPAASPAPTSPGRTCPITCRGAVTGPTPDLPTLVVDLNGKEIIIYE